MIKQTIEKPDYLVIGHITRDLHSNGISLGGTAAFSAVCADALGRTPAIATACETNYATPALDEFSVFKKESLHTTTFENIETPTGRKQILHSVAVKIFPLDIPKKWTSAPIVHLGPVADEIDPHLVDLFSDSFIGVTPQGWMRTRDENKHVQFKPWEAADMLLERANAVVISIEDVRGDEDLIHAYASKTKIMAVTEGFNGARIYWNGDVRHFSAPEVTLVDPTGAGDIFAAAFFDRMEKTSDPWESGKQAVRIASRSVTRCGLAGVPTIQEIRSFQIQLIEGK